MISNLSDIISKFTSLVHPCVQDVMWFTILSIIGSLPQMALFIPWTNRLAMVRGRGDGSPSRACSLSGNIMDVATEGVGVGGVGTIVYGVVKGLKGSSVVADDTDEPPPPINPSTTDRSSRV